MIQLPQGLLAVLGRTMLCAIFLVSVLGNIVPNLGSLVPLLASKGVPHPQWMLFAALVALLVGSISVILGYKARLGALLLLVFLGAATYYFHDFWTIWTAQARHEQMMEFMKNVSIMGAMLLVICNGPGSMSLDSAS